MLKIYVQPNKESARSVQRKRGLIRSDSQFAKFVLKAPLGF